MNTSEVKTFVESTVVNGIKHSPKFTLRGVNFAYYAIKNRMKFRNLEADQIMTDDWDNLIILDACRYDMFDDLNSISGELESRTSSGSSTVEFLEANFSNCDLSDSIYVTANPQLYNNQNRIESNFYDVINVWMDDGWDSEEGTVLPQTMTKRTLEAHENNPNKRIISHYVQPHFPFIGSSVGKGSFNHEDDELNIWEKMLCGETDESSSSLVKAYRENLRKALPHVEELVDGLNGRSVVTSDHGNMLGERSFPIPFREWGHPRGMYLQPLVKVPWLVIDADERREIKQEQAKDSSINSSSVEERLKQLGYVS
jgi:hypothetical protein